MYYIPFLSALTLAGGTILEKTILRVKKISVRTYQSFAFLALILLMAPLLFFFWGMENQAFETKNLIIFLAVILISVVSNLFYLYALKGDKITNTESARISEPLFVVLLAIIFSFFISESYYERDFRIIIPALIAGAALIFSQVKKNHLNYNKYFMSAIAGSFFFALELVISQIILNLYSPITFYFLRCSGIFLVSLIVLKPNFKEIDSKTAKKTFLVGIIWVIYRITLYYGYQIIGITETTLITMLAPVLIYIFAYKFLKERPSLKNIIASVIVILCVIYVILM